MSERKRVACFFTGGYTELNAMKLFMRKINNQLEYIQLCPTGPRKSKSMIQGRHTDIITPTHNGLTGDALINYILSFVKQKRFQEESYDAILIEDDKDHRFLSVQPGGTASLNIDELNRFEEDVRKKLNEICPDVPILFFLAAPEIEAWFIADWDNTFKKVYRDTLTTDQNNYFSFQFRKYVNEQILTQYYVNSIEEYGYFNGSYKKLSEEMQFALSKTDFLSSYRPAIEHRPIRYSKRVQGEMMLEEIDPQTVAEKCSLLFKKNLFDLQRL